MAKTIRKPVKKCIVCGKPAFSVHSMYCQTHERLAYRMKQRRYPPEAVEAVWDYIRQYGHRCQYSNVPLDMDDPTSPWYCTFDHVIPLDPRTIVLACALVNYLKTALSVDEFWYIVGQLEDNHQNGTPITLIQLKYWRQHVHPDPPIIPGKKPRWPHPTDKKCDICGQPVFSLQSKYCWPCSCFNKRMELKKFPAAVEEDIRRQLRAKGYVCAYTNTKLEMNDYRSPWYGTFDYLNPHDHTKVVLTCALFGEMKSDLTIQEFWYYIHQLANHHRYNTAVRKKKPRYWYRMLQSNLRLKSLLD